MLPLWHPIGHGTDGTPVATPLAIGFVCLRMTSLPIFFQGMGGWLGRVPYTYNGHIVNTSFENIISNRQAVTLIIVLKRRYINSYDHYTY